MLRPLTKSISRHINSFHLPKSETEFEDLCLDIFPSILRKHKIPKLMKLGPDYITYQGTRGDRQYGIDLRCKNSLAVAQCKHVKDLDPADLTKELNKLLQYKKEVSCYFFLISPEKAKSSLQDWVDEKNSDTENLALAEKVFPATPNVRLPWFYIFGWHEIKSYILDSTYLSLKWGVLDGFALKYPYLQGLKIDELMSIVTNIESGSVPTEDPSSEAFFGGRSLIEQTYVTDAKNLGKTNRVALETLNSLYNFTTLYSETRQIASSYPRAMKNLESEDLVTFENGLDQLNTLARYSARLSALQYLKPAYDAAKELLRMLDDDEFYSEETEIGVNYRGEPCDFTTGFVYFNFDNESNERPWPINGETIKNLAASFYGTLQQFFERGSGRTK